MRRRFGPSRPAPLGLANLTMALARRQIGRTDQTTARAVASIRDAGCQFLVFGRTIGDRFLSLSDVQVSDRLREICREVPEESFRDDVSSTGIRCEIQAE